MATQNAHRRSCTTARRSCTAARSSSAELDILFIVRVFNINRERRSRIRGRGNDEEFPTDRREIRGGLFAVFADHDLGKKGLRPVGRGGSGISGEPGQVMPTF